MFHLEFEYTNGEVEDSVLEYPKEDARKLAVELWRIRPLLKRVSVKDREGKSHYDYWHFS